MITQERTESRKDYLLRVTIAFIEENMLEEFRVDYDGATCDGSCLAAEIKSALENE